jgi:nucleoside phosphorylase
MKNIGLVCATRFEAGPILRAFKFRYTARNLFGFRRNDKTVWLVICGIGMEAARAASYKLCDMGVNELVSVGYCGALSPELNVGDVVTDRVATSPTAVWKREKRVALAERAGAQAVDMETQAIIEAGTRRGVPIRVLRVISDRLNDDVSPLLGEEPNFSPIRIALRLWNPTRWPYLVKLWRQSRVASQALVKAVREYLQTNEAL